MIQSVTKKKLELLKEDVKNFGVLFLFKDNEETKTGIIRKGQWSDKLFKDDFLPESWSRMSRRQRRTL